MNKFISTALLLVMTLTCSAQKQMIIKYSTQDCMFCNAPLFNMPYGASEGIYVWMKASSRADPELEDVVKTIKSRGMQVLYSDSAYYSIDSSERSKVYLFENNSLQGVHNLKDMNAELITKYFNAAHRTGQILAKKIVKVSSDENNIYLLDDYKRLLTVSKDDLNKTINSVEIDDSMVRESYMKALAKARGESRFLQYQSVLQKAHLSNKVRINDFYVNKDTTFFAMSFAFADSSKRKGIFASFKPFISVFVKGKLVSIYTIDGITKDVNTNTKLTLDAFNFAYRRGEFILSINTDTLTRNAPLMAVTRPVDGAIKLLFLPKYYLPEHLVSTNIGYMLSGMISSRRFISNVYSSLLYNIDNDKTIELGFPHDSNSFTLAQVTSLRFKTKFQVVGLYDNNNKLTLLIKNNGAVECIMYRLLDDKPSFISRHLISGVDSKYIYSNWITCDQNGFYLFNKDENSIQYISYL